MKVLVTGAYGQLGRCIYDVVTDLYHLPYDEYLFTSHKDFDITNLVCMEGYLLSHPDIECIINCAGYTNVDGAEKDPYTAFYINSRGVQNLVQLCEKYDIMLFHISTDYVYKDGQGICNEESEIEPINIYGQSKRDGELHIINSKLKNWYILRTSWLYSEYPGNFFTKILDQCTRSAAHNLTVVDDEIGSPTYAKSLAELIVCIIQHGYYATTLKSGIYNASGNGMASRYDFAANIISGAYHIKVNDKELHIKVPVYPIKQADLNLPAKRPHCVVMDNKKIYQYIPISRDHWSYDLSTCITNYENNMNHKIKEYKILYGKDLY